MMKYRKIIELLLFVSASFLTACASNNDSALESYNRSMYSINRGIDRYTLKPIAKGYKAVTPDMVERRVSNFFGNIGEIGTMANSLLQGKLHNLALSSSRFVWNTTIGLGGLFDVATAMDIKANQEDFGQTLRYWGVPAGPYIVLPLLGPSTPADSIGLLGDAYFSPLFHVDSESIEVVNNTYVAMSIISDRANLLEAEELLQHTATDEYSFVKSAYLQRRESLTNDGNSAADTELDEDFDALFEE